MHGGKLQLLAVKSCQIDAAARQQQSGLASSQLLPAYRESISCEDNNSHCTQTTKSLAEPYPRKQEVVHSDLC